MPAVTVFLGLGALVLTGLALLAAGASQKLPVTFDPACDISTLGLLASLWRYSEEERCRPSLPSPFAPLPTGQGEGQMQGQGQMTPRPHLVAVQSESSGLAEEQLGVHRFNPYRQLARAGIPTLVSVLKAQGYRTVCVHPYPVGFYSRDQVFPLLGFDAFIDIRAFADAQKNGPYVGDISLAEKVCSLLDDT
ncbi:sulfatase-like hydrolase/transferase, partial [bacterium]|nr:sulfatase-like hydrolase/transferase [bacterium]